MNRNPTTLIKLSKALMCFLFICLVISCEKKEGKLILNTSTNWNILSIDDQEGYVLDTTSYRTVPILITNLTQGEHTLKLISHFGDTLVTKIDMKDSLYFSDLVKDYFTIIAIDNPYSAIIRKDDTLNSILVNNFKNDTKLFIEKTSSGCFGGNIESFQYERKGDSILITKKIKRLGSDKFNFSPSYFKPKELLDSLIRFERSLYSKRKVNCLGTSNYSYVVKCSDTIISSRRYYLCMDSEVNEIPD